MEDSKEKLMQRCLPLLCKQCPGWTDRWLQVLPEGEPGGYRALSWPGFSRESLLDFEKPRKWGFLSGCVCVYACDRQGLGRDVNTYECSASQSQS